MVAHDVVFQTMRAQTWCLLVVGGWLLPAVGVAQTPRLESTLPALMDSAGIPGLSIAVIEGGRVTWSGAYGHLNDADLTPVDDQTVFAAASLSKPVFAYVVMRLADRGEFDIDRPLWEYLPYERLEGEPEARDITARIVMSHGTGLRNWQDGPMNITFTPGSGFMYSGEGFVYLQKTVEHVTGLSIEALARREVFEPLSMTRTSYVWQDAFDGNAVTGSDASDQAQGLPRRTEGNAAHSLLTTANDYAKFVIAVMQGEGLQSETVGAIVSHQNVARRPPRPTPADPYIFWGLGWGIQEGRAGRAFWHWGDNGAWRCYVVAFPERETAVVYFTNSYNGLSIARAVAASVIDDDHWAVDWIDYERYDDPGRLTRRAIAAAFVEGVDAGVRDAEGRYAVDPDGFDLRLMRNVGQYLSGRGMNDAAVAALELNVTFFPDSAASHEQLGEALHQAGRYAAAIVAYRASLAIDPYNPPVAKRIDWIGSRLAVERDPVTVSREQLERYVGVYGPRRVTLGDRGLVYQRDGNREYDLIPLGEDLFALEGLETFRMLFVGEIEGSAEKIVGVYFDGSSDESVRSP